MSVSVTFNGLTYTLPSTDDTNWGTNVTGFMQAVASGALSKAGGTFTLTADADFGGTYGLKATYFTSRTSSAATAGVLRLANTDLIEFRNAANSANLTFGVDSSNNLEFGGVDVVTVSGTQTLTNKTLTSPTVNGGTIASATLTAPTISSSPSVSAATISFHANASPANTTANFLRPFHYSGTASTNEVKWRVPFACKVSNLYYICATAATGGTTVITVRKGGSDQTLTVTVAAGTTTGEDVANSFTASAGDQLSVKIQHGSGISAGTADPIVALKLTQA